MNKLQIQPSPTYLLIKVKFDLSIASLTPTGPVLNVATIDSNSGYGSIRSAIKLMCQTVIGHWKSNLAEHLTIEDDGII